VFWKDKSCNIVPHTGYTAESGGSNLQMKLVCFFSVLWMGRSCNISLGVLNMCDCLAVEERHGYAN
jgi:hypothetical protein